MKGYSMDYSGVERRNKIRTVHNQQLKEIDWACLLVLTAGFLIGFLWSIF